MIDPTRIYHMGVVVPDLEKAMDELTKALGYTWSAMRSMDVDILTPAGPGRVSPMKVAFTRQGPPWLEYIEAPAGSIWSSTDGPSLHHLGFFVDDLEGEKKQLEALGFTFETGGLGPNGQLAGFAYHKNPHGGRVELVDERIKAGMMAWITG